MAFIWILSKSSTLTAPKLDTVLQLGLHEGRVEGDNHFPDYPSFDAAQGIVGLQGCKHTLLAHVKFLIYQDP